MKAVLCKAYGPPEVLEVREVEKPLPGKDDVLIKIYVSTVTMGDCELRTLTLPLWTRIPVRLYMGYRKPKRFIPGMEFSGVVQSVGKDVVSFKPGDRVFVSSGLGMGGNAEYKSMRATRAIALMPANVSFEQVAPIAVGGLNALHFLRKANIQPGHKVLINGACGSIGTFGVQLAKLYGAEVTAVDAGEKLDVLRTLGADHVIDYRSEDFSGNGIKYDVIFDTVYRSDFSRCINSLTENGYYLMANPGPRRMVLALWVSLTTRKKVIFEFAAERIEDMRDIAQLIASGKIRTVVDRRHWIRFRKHTRMSRVEPRREMLLLTYSIPVRDDNCDHSGNLADGYAGVLRLLIPSLKLNETLHT
jgi:NADPH:quinone reductase-like Zn-dependent oxidoreductase